MFGFQTPDELLLFAYRHMMAEQAAANRETPDITYGSYWVRVIDFVPEIVVIFGHVEPLESLSSKALDSGADPLELAMERASIQKMHERGLMYGRCYSELCPEGEYGNAYIGEILMAISEEDFEAARKAEWQLLPLILEGREFASKVMGLAGLEETDE